jgi:hypothetical protein
LTDAQVEQAVRVFDYYGQNTGDMPEDVVKKV